MPAPLTLPPAVPLAPRAFRDVCPPEVHAAAALRAELDRRGVTCLYARAVAALEAARVEVLRCAQACDAESAARGLEGSYHAAAAEVLDNAETALLHIVEALPSADTLWDRAADAEACR